MVVTMNSSDTKIDHYYSKRGKQTFDYLKQLTSNQDDRENSFLDAYNDGRILAEMERVSFITPELFTLVFRGLEAKYNLFEQSIMIESYLTHKLGEIIW